MEESAPSSRHFSRNLARHLREGSDRAVRSVFYGTELGKGATPMQEGKETLTKYFSVVSMMQKKAIVWHAAYNRTNGFNNGKPLFQQVVG